MKKILLLLMASAYGCFSQTFEKDLELVYKNFTSSAYISYNIEYLLRASHHKDSRIISKSSGKYVKADENCLSIFDSKTTLITRKEIILIDTEDKIIKVKKASGKPAEAPDFMEVLRNSSSTISEVKRDVSPDKKLIIYTVKLKANELSPISHYHVSIDPKNQQLQSMSLFYKKPLQEDEEYNISGKEIPRLDIIFSDFSVSKEKMLKQAEASYYYTRSQNKINPSINFKGYAIKEVF